MKHKVIYSTSLKKKEQRKKKNRYQKKPDKNAQTKSIGKT